MFTDWHLISLNLIRKRKNIPFLWMNLLKDSINIEYIEYKWFLNQVDFDKWLLTQLAYFTHIK